MDRVEAHVIVFFPQYLRIHCPVAKENKELMNFIAPGDNPDRRGHGNRRLGQSVFCVWVPRTTLAYE